MGLFTVFTSVLFSGSCFDATARTTSIRGDKFNAVFFYFKKYPFQDISCFVFTYGKMCKALACLLKVHCEYYGRFFILKDRYLRKIRLLVIR
jgi:hypothetical protein